MSIIGLLTALIEIYTLLIVVRIVASWIPEGRGNAIVRYLGRVTEPYLRLFRVIPPIGGVDISPIAALAALWIVKRLLVSLMM